MEAGYYRLIFCGGFVMVRKLFEAIVELFFTEVFIILMLLCLLLFGAPVRRGQNGG